MLPSLKSRHGVQKRGPNQKFANQRVFFFDDLKKIFHKKFFVQTLSLMKYSMSP
jgi:hypothetical protein